MFSPSLERFSRYLKLFALLGVTTLLSACLHEQQVVQSPPPGYFPNPARILHETTNRTLIAQNWPGSQEMTFPVAASSQADVVREYFLHLYPQLPSAGWQDLNHVSVVYDQEGQAVDLSHPTLFDLEHTRLLAFEPQVPSFAEKRYADLQAALQASVKPLKLALDDGDFKFARDYVGSSRAENQDAITGIVYFFELAKRPHTTNGDLVYGVFAYYDESAVAIQTAQQDKAQLSPYPKAPVRVDALLYDREKHLFYHQAQGHTQWLYAVAHPLDKNLPVWSGDQKTRFKGIQARGGQCGQSVRAWFSKKNQDIPSWGFYHLGYGKVRYNKQGEPTALSHSIAFDQERAKNLIFEPQPPLKEKALKDYQARIQVLAAKRSPLMFALDKGEISTAQEYMGASRGARSALSHTGVVRFYPADERIKDAGNRTVYGEFIHNWNRRKRSGPMTISALYYDANNHLFYWKTGQGHKKKMWIYGIAEPQSMTVTQKSQSILP